MQPLVAVVLVWLISATTALAQSAVETELIPESRFQRTVNYLIVAPAEERADFAATALFELTAVYAAEADLARSEASQLEVNERGKLLSWSIAVDQYASQLLLVLDDVEQGFPVTLRPGSPGPVVVSVADRAVILGHPRADQQAAFEARVLTDFCSPHDCERMTASEEEPEPIPMSAMRVNPLWTFTETGPVCSNDALELHFHSRANLAVLRGICEQLVQELASLAAEFAWQIRHSVQIDWNALLIEATPGRPEHLVRLNTAGDSVLVTVPLLHNSAQLLADVRPWLLARATGQAAVATRLNAADYGWEPSQP